MTDVHVVLPDSVDRADRPSGGNVYDRRLCDALTALGWTVHEHLVPGEWPHPDPRALATLADELAAVPSGALLLVDGLVASCSPDIVVPQADRVRLVTLVHMPLGSHAAGDEAERRVLTSSAAIVTTSEWTRGSLAQLYGLDSDRLRVASPGVDDADLAPGTTEGGRLLCVAAVTRGKGHDLLLDALARVEDLPWSCMCAGSVEIEPSFASVIRQRATRVGLGDRVRLVGPLSRVDLDRAYAAADLVVLPSRSETYGMVVSEALARGLPVVATAVGGVPEALNGTAESAHSGEEGQLGDPGPPLGPGLLVPPDDPDALASALRQWLTDPELRAGLRRAARERRAGLSSWAVTADEVSDVLARLTR